MPTFSQSLEQSLHRALAIANERHHQYATLEHLLLSLIDDLDAAAVMRACSVDLDKLRTSLVNYLETEFENLVTDGGRRRQADRRFPARDPARGDSRPVVRSRRSDRRQRADRDLRGARKPRRLFPAGAGHDAVRRGQLHQPWHRQASRRFRSAAGSRRRRGDRDQGQRGRQEKGRGARYLLRQPQQEGARRQDRSRHRTQFRNQPGDPGAVPPAEEQSAVRRRSRRRQDRDRRRPCQAHRRLGSAGSAGGGDRVLARHGHAARGHALSRRFRRAAEAGAEGTGGASERDPVHRRDPHRDRRRRHLRRRDGCVQSAQAGAGIGHDPLHGLDHLQGIPPAFRKGSRAGAPVPEDRRQRADGGRRHRDPQGPETLFRGLPPAEIHQRGDRGRGAIVVALHPRPQAAGQGDRRDRRVGRGADAGGREQAQEDHRHQGDRDHDRDHGADSAQERVEGRCRGAQASRADAEARGVRPGQGDRRAVGVDQAGACRPARAGKADRLLSVLRSDRRRQDRSGKAARGVARRRADPLRHVRIYGAAHGVAPDRRASGLCRLRPGRPA